MCHAAGFPCQDRYRWAARVRNRVHSFSAAMSWPSTVRLSAGLLGPNPSLLYHFTTFCQTASIPHVGLAGLIYKVSSTRRTQRVAVRTDVPNVVFILTYVRSLKQKHRN